MQRCFEAIQVNIKVNMDPLDSASTFPYLGFTIAYNNSDWVALYHNLSKAQRCWVMMLGVMMKACTAVHSRSMFCKAVVQAVLIYGSDIWFIVVTMMKVM